MRYYINLIESLNEVGFQYHYMPAQLQDIITNGKLDPVKFSKLRGGIPTVKFRNGETYTFSPKGNDKVSIEQLGVYRKNIDGKVLPNEPKPSEFTTQEYGGLGSFWNPKELGVPFTQVKWGGGSAEISAADFLKLVDPKQPTY